MSPPGEFTCAVQRLDEAIVLLPRGELDLATAPDFERVANEALEGELSHVVVDLRELTFMDSSGMRAFLRLQARLDPRIRFELIPGPPQVQRVFELAGLTAALPFRS